MFKKEILFPDSNISAIIPYYTAAGDTTTIMAMTGEQQSVNTRIPTILNHLARHYSIDLISLRKKVSLVTHHTLLQPLPLTPELVLCPIKVRNPCVPGDLSTGYINLHAVMNIRPNPNVASQSIIQLTGGIELPSLWKQDTVRKQLHYGKLALLYTANHHALHPNMMLLSQKLSEVYALLTLTSPHGAAQLHVDPDSVMRIR